ncbi:MAG TPA: TMEM175 family protein [Methanotrichaceae archaeon]|nr:TMEM175 family protein [Methanotrichaceae archaeon]
MPDEQESKEREEKEESLSTSRVEALADGVFAFAMTLMVLTIDDVPTNVPKADENQVIIQHLFQIIPDFGIYVLAFISLGGFWYAHQIQFKSMKRVDPILIWLNILMMMFIALVPFSTGLAGDYENAQISALVMEVNILTLGIIFYAHWSYATTHLQLLHKPLDKKEINLGKDIYLIIILISLVAIGLSFISPPFSVALYILMPFSLAARHRIKR